MKKAWKILLYIFGSLILLGVLVLVFHNHIISYSLRKVITNKSEGKVELALESFELNIMDGSIYIDRPVLILQDVFMDETKNIAINKVVFEKIEIDRLDIKKLIFERSIIAHHFLIDKPEFWLTELGNKSQSSFHPEKLIKILNQNPDMFSRVLFRIGDIEIHYGSILLSEFVSENADPGLVDFTIILENFDSKPDNQDTTNRILFSDEFRFRLKNLHKELKSGYTLDIDSAIFTSSHNDLLIGGASLQPTNQNIKENSVGMKAGQIKLNDISLEEVRGLEDLSLRSIILADGEFVNFNNVKSKAKNDTSSQGLDQLNKLLYDLRLDSIDITNFNYYNVHDFKDTVIYTNDIEFLMTDIVIDSGMFIDLLHNLHYNDVTLNTGSFAINKLIPNLAVSYKRLAYSNEDRYIKLFDVKMISDTTSSKTQPIHLNIPEFEVRGASLPDMQKRKKQHLTISILNPEGDIDLTGLLPDSTSAKSKAVFPGYLLLDKIILENGDFNISKKDDFAIGLKGLDVELSGLKLPETVNEKYSYKRISFSYNEIDTYFEEAKLGLASGNMYFDSNQLQLSDIRMNSNLTGKNGYLSIRKIKLGDFDLKRLVFENELNLGQFTLDSPEFNGEISLKNSHQKPGNKSFEKMLAPIFFKVGEVTVKNGKIDSEILLEKDTIQLKTNYDLKLAKLSARKGDSLKLVLKEILWNLNLTDVDAIVANHQISSQQIQTDAFGSIFFLKKFAVSAKPSALLKSKKIALKSLMLPELSISGLQYDLLVNYDSIAFSRILIDSLDIDIRLKKADAEQNTNVKKKIDLKDYLVFNYDTILMNNLNVSVEKPGELSSKNFSLKNFNLNHNYTLKGDNNLMNNFGLSFTEFLQYDSVANKFISIHGGKIELGDNDLIINGIRGGDIVDEVDAESKAGSSGMMFTSDNIRLTDITIEESLPSKLRIGKLLIGDFDLRLKRVPDEQKKSSFKINLELMNQFSKVMTRLSIDTTKLEDISLTYQTIEDTSMHTIDFDSISLVVNKINYDTAMINQSRPNLIGNLSVDLHGRTRITQDSLYEIQTGRLHYDFPKHRVTIDSFYMVPRYDEEAFFKKAVYQITRTKLFSRKMELNNVDFEKLFKDDHLHLGSINVINLNAEMYRDKRNEIKPGTFKKLPREAIMSITQKFTIDTLRVIDSYLKYKQIEEKSFVPGEIYFTQFNGDAYDITNVLKEGKRQNLKIEASARIMDNARMDVDIFFPLHADSTAFWLDVKTEPIDLTVLNSMTENLLGLGITRGVGSVDAQFISGNDSLAKGNLIFRYKKLELKRYNRKKSQLKKKGFLNFLINDLVVKSNNPKFARKPRVGQVYFVRETEKGVVAYLFRSLLTGLTSTLGFNNKEQRLERKEDRKNQ